MFLRCRKTILGSHLNSTCLGNIETACLRLLSLQNEAHTQAQASKEDLAQPNVQKAVVKFRPSLLGLE